MHKKPVRAQNINTMGSFSFLLSLHQIGATFEFIKYNLNTLLIPSRKKCAQIPQCPNSYFYCRMTVCHLMLSYINLFRKKHFFGFFFGITLNLQNTWNSSASRLTLFPLQIL